LASLYNTQHGGTETPIESAVTVA